MKIYSKEIVKIITSIQCVKITHKKDNTKEKADKNKSYIKCKIKLISAESFLVWLFPNKIYKINF